MLSLGRWPKSSHFDHLLYLSRRLRGTHIICRKPKTSKDRTANRKLVSFSYHLLQRMTDRQQKVSVSLTRLSTLTRRCFRRKVCEIGPWVVEEYGRRGGHRRMSDIVLIVAGVDIL